MKHILNISFAICMVVSPDNQIHSAIIRDNTITLLDDSRRFGMYPPNKACSGLAPESAQNDDVENDASR